MGKGKDRGWRIENRGSTFWRSSIFDSPSSIICEGFYCHRRKLEPGWLQMVYEIALDHELTTPGPSPDTGARCAGTRQATDSQSY